MVLFPVICGNSKELEASLAKLQSELTRYQRLTEELQSSNKALEDGRSLDAESFKIELQSSEEKLNQARAAQDALQQETNKLLSSKAQLQEDVIGYLKELRTKDEKMFRMQQDLADAEFELEQLRVAYKCTAQYSVEQEAAKQALHERLSLMSGDTPPTAGGGGIIPGDHSGDQSGGPPSRDPTTRSIADLTNANSAALINMGLGGVAMAMSSGASAGMGMGRAPDRLSAMSGVSSVSRVPSSNGVVGSPRLWGPLGETLGGIEMDGPLPYPPTPASSVIATPHGSMASMHMVRGRHMVMDRRNGRRSGSAPRGQSPERQLPSPHMHAHGHMGSPAPGGMGPGVPLGSARGSRRPLGSGSESTHSGTASAFGGPPGYGNITDLAAAAAAALEAAGIMSGGRGGNSMSNVPPMDGQSFRSFDPLASNSTLATVGDHGIHSELDEAGGDSQALPDVASLDEEQLRAEVVKLRAANASLQRQVATLQKQNDLLQLRQLGGSTASAASSLQPPASKRYGYEVYSSYFGTVLTQQQQQQQQQQAAQQAGLGLPPRMPLATVPEESSKLIWDSPPVSFTTGLPANGTPGGKMQQRSSSKPDAPVPAAPRQSPFGGLGSAAAAATPGISAMAPAPAAMAPMTAYPPAPSAAPASSSAPQDATAGVMRTSGPGTPAMPQAAATSPPVSSSSLAASEHRLAASELSFGGGVPPASGSCSTPTSNAAAVAAAVNASAGGADRQANGSQAADPHSAMSTPTSGGAHEGRGSNSAAAGSHITAANGITLSGDGRYDAGSKAGSAVALADATAGSAHMPPPLNELLGIGVCATSQLLAAASGNAALPRSPGFGTPVAGVHKPSSSHSGGGSSGSVGAAGGGSRPNSPPPAAAGCMPSLNTAKGATTSPLSAPDATKSSGGGSGGGASSSNNMLPPPPPGVDAGLWELELLCAGAIAPKPKPPPATTFTSSSAHAHAPVIPAAPWWNVPDDAAFSAVQGSGTNGVATKADGLAVAAGPAGTSASAFPASTAPAVSAGESSSSAAAAGAAQGGMAPGPATGANGNGNGLVVGAGGEDNGGLARAGSSGLGNGHNVGHGMWLPG